MKIIELKNPTFNKNNIQQLLEKKICLVGVFSKLCIHCNNMKPQWNMLKKRLKKGNCNGLLLEIDSDQLNNIESQYRLRECLHRYRPSRDELGVKVPVVASIKDGKTLRYVRLGLQFCVCDPDAAMNSLKKKSFDTSFTESLLH